LRLIVTRSTRQERQRIACDYLIHSFVLRLASRSAPSFELSPFEAYVSRDTSS